MLRWPRYGLKAQSNTAKCSGLRPLRTVGAVFLRHVFNRVVFLDVRDDAFDDVVARSPAGARHPERSRLTIFNMPPPASSLYFTSAMSGSTPVVSQSIRKAMVPVGASTVTCALR